jgi:tetratricopeptide (TPR) repeat protein
MDRGKLDQAAASFMTAIKLRSDYAATYYNLGNARAEQGRLEEAVACYRKAIGLKTDYKEAHNNLANALQYQGRLEEAVASSRKAIALRPDYAEAHNNLGASLKQQGQPDAAIGCFRTTLALRPDYPHAHFNLATSLLAQGSLSAGWEALEWRWQTPQMIQDHRVFAQPQWRGQAAEGRTLLIHAEQGLGDTLHFCRYAPLAADRGLRVILEVPKPLVRLLGGLRASTGC